MSHFQAKNRAQYKTDNLYYYKASMIPKDTVKEAGLFEVENGLIFDLIGYIKKCKRK